jgi:uncharacterized membrane protein YhhN
MVTILAAISAWFELKLGYYIGNGVMIPILIFFILQKFKENDSPLLPLLVVALIFSFLGDLMMMIPTEERFFTLIGICTFMMSQVSLGFLFFKSVDYQYLQKGPIQKRWVEVLFLVAIAFVFSQVYTYLGDYFTAGLIFLLITSSSFLLGLNRRFYVNKYSFRVIMIGLILFLTSDTLSALDLFMTNPIIHTSIILCYGVGHIFITNGILIQIDKTVKKEKAPSFGAFSKTNLD